MGTIHFNIFLPLGIVYQTHGYKDQGLHLAVACNIKLAPVRAVCFGRVMSNADYPLFDATEVYNRFRSWLNFLTSFPNHPMLLPYVIMEIESENESLFGGSKLDEMYRLEEDNGYHSWKDIQPRSLMKPDYAKTIRQLSIIASSCVELEPRAAELLKVTQSMKEHCDWITNCAARNQAPDVAACLKRSNHILKDFISINAAKCQKNIDITSVSAKKAEILLGVVRLRFSERWFSLNFLIALRSYRTTHRD